MGVAVLSAWLSHMSLTYNDPRGSCTGLRGMLIGLGPKSDGVGRPTPSLFGIRQPQPPSLIVPAPITLRRIQPSTQQNSECICPSSADYPQCTLPDFPSRGDLLIAVGWFQHAGGLRRHLLATTESTFDGIRSTAKRASNGELLCDACGATHVRGRGSRPPRPCRMQESAASPIRTVRFAKLDPDLQPHLFSSLHAKHTSYAYRIRAHHAGTRLNSLRRRFTGGVPQLARSLDNLFGGF